MSNTLPDFEFDVNSLVQKKDYLENSDALPYFKQRGTIEPFLKKHKAALVTTGAVFVQRGPGGTMINVPRFNVVAADLLREEARQYAEPFATI